MENNRLPKLRFEGFDHDWILEKIDPYLEQYVERVPANTKFPILTSSRTGLHKQSDYFDNRELANKGMYGVVPRGYFTYRHMSDDSTFKFNINTLCDKGAISKEYPVFKTINMDSTFLIHKLNFGPELKRFAIAQKLGGTRVRLYFKKLRQLEFRIPSLLEQQKIASFLSAVDEKTRQLTRKKELLEEYKKGVMQQLFFGKLRFKDEKGKHYPNWSTKKLGDVAKIYDGTHQTPTYVSQGIPFYSVEHVTANQFAETRYIAEDVFEKENKRVRLEKGDILMTRIGDIGTARLIDWDVKASFYVSLALLKPSESILSKYLNQYIASRNFQLELWKRIIHVAFPKKINLGEIGNCLIKVPVMDEQQKIANYLSDLDNKIKAVTTQISQTQTFKKGLLQQMFV